MIFLNPVFQKLLEGDSLSDEEQPTKYMPE